MFLFVLDYVSSFELCDLVMILFGFRSARSKKIHITTFKGQKPLFSPSYNGGIYQRLIVNITAAILTQDLELQTLNILLKYLFQDDLFVSCLALEVLSLISRYVWFGCTFISLIEKVDTHL